MQHVYNYGCFYPYTSRQRLLLRVIIIAHYILLDLTSDPSKRVADFTAMCQNVHTTTLLVSYTTEQQLTVWKSVNHLH